MNDKLDHRLYVTYKDFNGWEHVESRLSKYLLIPDLKWVSKDEVFTQDVVCDVDVGFLAQAEYDRMTGHQATFPFVNLHQEPYVKLFFVAPKDYEEYKNEVRPLLREWVASMQDRDVEYLIVYIDLNKKQGVFDKLNLRSIFGNLQTEFNKHKHDRVCQFKPNSREESDSTWQSFWQQLKEALGRSVERVVDQYKREVQKLLHERPLPGWNYCKYFTVVEGLAFVYEALRLYEEGLCLYDDLEGFQLSMDEREISLPIFGGNEKGDDSGSVLDFNKKNYRMKIATSTITEFDFKQYLFARQCKLLFCHGRPVKIAERAMNFIRNFMQLLRAEKFSERYCNSWGFTAYMDVAETLRATILRGGVGGAVTNMSPLKSADPVAIAEQLDKTPKLSARNLQRLSYLLGDIYYNARVTLEHLGSSFRLLPLDSRVILSQESLKQYNITSLVDNTPVTNQVLPTNRKLFLEEGKDDVQLMEILGDESRHDEKLEEESLDKETARKNLELLSLSQSPPADVIIPPPEGTAISTEPLTDVTEYTSLASPELKKRRKRGSLRVQSDSNSNENSDDSDEEIESSGVQEPVNEISANSLIDPTAPQENTNVVQNTPVQSEATKEDHSSDKHETPVETSATTNASAPSNNNTGVTPVSAGTSADNKSVQGNTENSPAVTLATAESAVSEPKKAEDTPATSGVATDTKSEAKVPSKSTTPVSSKTPTSAKREPAYQSGKVDFSKIRDGTFDITHPILMTGIANEASFDKLYTSLTNKAIQCYADVERHRSVMRLSQELGNLHFVRGNYDNAVTLLKSVLNLTNSAASAGSSVDNWHPLSFVVHHRLALVHLMNNNFSDFLTSLVELLSPPMLALLSDNDESARLQQWYFDLLLDISKHKLTGTGSEQSMSSVIEPAISFPGFGFTRQCNMRDTVTINVHLTSSLPQPLVADKLCLQLFSQKRVTKANKPLAGDKTPRGSEQDKPNFVVIDLTSVNVEPGKNVYSLTFKPPSKSRYICYKLWIEVGNLILSQTLLPPSIDNPHQLQRKHYKTFNYNNIANNQRIWSINVAHSSPTALLHVNQSEHGHMVVGCWQTVQVVIDTEDDQLTNKPCLYIKSKNLITTSGSAVQTPSLEESSDSVTDTPTAAPEPKDDKNKEPKGPVEFPLVIPDKFQLKARVVTKEGETEVVNHVTVQLLNGQVVLPTLLQHTRIEFDLPLKAMHSTDHIHEVSFTLKYREVCNEKFTINQLSDLHFIQPFNTAQFILANKPNNRILLRVILESLCPSPIEIIEYRRDTSADENNKDYKPVLDFNHYIKAMTIKPKEKVSLLFELERLVQKSTAQGTSSGALKSLDDDLVNNALLVAFTFYYRFTKYEHKEIGQVKVDPRHGMYNTAYLEWKHFVHFDELNKNSILDRSLTGPLPSDQYDYEYSLTTPHAEEPHCKGRWILVTLRVHRLTKTSTAPPAEISYRLEYDSASWLVSGKIRGYLRPSATGHEHVLNFRLLPLVAGQLPLPSLQLDSLSLLFKATNINHYYNTNYAHRGDTSRDQHVIVFPQSSVTSVTEKIVLNDPQSKPYFS